MWQGWRNHDGYGMFWLEGRDQIASRIAWLIEHGDPGELCVLHRCDNPPCVRPSHLFLGTIQENHEDMRRKGRSLRGSKNHNALLNDELVRWARWLYEDGFSQVEIARHFRVGRSAVQAVVSGRAWKHVR